MVLGWTGVVKLGIIDMPYLVPGRILAGIASKEWHVFFYDY